jgi:hypothetical protein
MIRNSQPAHLTRNTVSAHEEQYLAAPCVLNNGCVAHVCVNVRVVHAYVNVRVSHACVNVRVSHAYVNVRVVRACVNVRVSHGFAKHRCASPQ